MKTAVLLITFNRPETTKLVFEKIRNYKPDRLYISSDGPRLAIPGEKESVEACRALLTEKNVDWNCKTSYWFETENHGCATSVTNAINRAFDEVDRLIILEDDVVPGPGFFTFCEEMLDRYERNEKVMHIAGTRWNEEFGDVQDDHYFTSIGHIWGWATWKRAWKRYDFEINDFPKLKNDKILLQRFNSARISRYWHARFKEVYGTPKKRTWDYQWQFSMFFHDGVAVVPNVNLVSNIGLTGEHSDGSKSEHHFRPLGEWNSIESPDVPVSVDLEFEKYHIRKRFLKKPPIVRRLRNRIQLILKLKH